ncbi:C25 family cysteine peptidase [Chitinophaga caseinilytica]|uniref:C25 family cysteine peptidase n=1 Tax=Chitinophaga caseinilytica TaxID=2267521 RepID=UPI003C30A007
MSNENQPQKGGPVAGEKQSLSNLSTVRTQVLQDRTVFNMQAVGRNYKLAQAYQSVRNLRLTDPNKIRLSSFAEYAELNKNILNFTPLIEEKPRPAAPAAESYLNVNIWLRFPKGKVLILVHKDVYAATKERTDRYVLDLARDGYWATVHVVSGGKPAYIRNYIRSKSPVGAVMVGAIPVAWFEMSDDFNGSSSEFPCDLFYMDTNGTWTDTDADGKYNAVSGDVTPEIWIGRVWTPTLGGNDATLINNYFDRNHLFRTGNLGHSRSALAYVEDDWTSFDDCEMDLMTPASFITKYTNPNITDADLYKDEVNKMRSFVQLCSHSSPHVHSFHIPATGTTEWIDRSYFRDSRAPNAHFYNLFCCSTARYTQDDYLGGWYIFDKAGGETNYGLTAVGSTKTGSMLFFADFYDPIGKGKCIGDAMVDWWKARGTDHDLGERQWFYGMSILGDPTLTWWKGAVPRAIEPADGSVFNHYPRTMTFKWLPVNIPGATYSIEIDAFGAVNAGQWAAQSFRNFAVFHGITGTNFNYNFVGAQPGRWRVRAKIGDRYCAWSCWCYFKFTI